MWAILLLAGGCSQLTLYRQTLFTTPAVPPAALGAPLPPGEYAVGGYASYSGIGTYEDPVSEEGDPGLRLSPLALGAHGRAGLGRWMEVGAAVDYADYGWSGENRVGVLGIPSHAPSWGVGGHLTVGNSAAVHGWGATLDAQWLSLPYARYLYTGPAEYLDDPTFLCCVDGDRYYTLQETGSAHPIRVRAAVAYQYRQRPFEAALGVAAAPIFTNTGFSSEPEAVYEDGGLALIPVVDLGVFADPVRFGVQAWYAAGVVGPTGGLERGPGARLAVEYRPAAEAKLTGR